MARDGLPIFRESSVVVLVVDRGLGGEAGVIYLYKRALAIREKALGPEHPSVARALRTMPPCCVRPDAAPMRQRWKPAPGRSGPKHAERNPAN